MGDGREKWSGRVGFMLATVGSAVGIGSIWKFPYEVGSNGGSAFVAFYLVGLALVVVPLMLAEFAIGHRGRGDPASSIAAVARNAQTGRLWGLAGLAGIVTGFLILSFYAVIGGWTLAYAVQTAVDGLPPARPAASKHNTTRCSMLLCACLFITRCSWRPLQESFREALRVGSKRRARC